LERDVTKQEAEQVRAMNGSHLRSVLREAKHNTREAKQVQRPQFGPEQSNFYLIFKIIPANKSYFSSSNQFQYQALLFTQIIECKTQFIQQPK
jgi:hypothetical protein